MITRKVTFLIPASPTAGFMSQIAAFALALKRLQWTHWLPTTLVCFGEGMERNACEAYIRWKPHLQDVTMVFAQESEPSDHYYKQIDGVFRWAPSDADVLVRMDADALPVGNLEDVLDLVLESSAIAGAIAHYKFPDRSMSNQQGWLSVAEDFLSEPLRFNYNYSLAGTDWPDAERVAPYYLNDGCIFFARRYFDQFVPLYLKTRPKLMNKLEDPYYAGQIALALSAARIDLPAIALPLRYNFPNDEIAAARYPEEMLKAIVIHYLRTNDIERQNIFQNAEYYLDFLNKPMNTPNEVFRTAVLKLFGKTYPFPNKEEKPSKTMSFRLPISWSGRLCR